MGDKLTEFSAPGTQGNFDAGDYERQLGKRGDG
jgi:hypothetical protein